MLGTNKVPRSNYFFYPQATRTPPLKPSQNDLGKQCSHLIFLRAQLKLTTFFFGQMSIRTEVVTIFVKCLLDYIVFITKYPLVIVKQINMKNNSELKTSVLDFKDYFPWYKITRIWESVSPSLTAVIFWMGLNGMMWSDVSALTSQMPPSISNTRRRTHAHSFLLLDIFLVLFDSFYHSSKKFLREKGNRMEVSTFYKELFIN